MKLIDDNSKPFTHQEIRYCLVNIMNYTLRKANVRPSRSLWPELNENRIIFKELISMHVQTWYLIVHIDEWSFNPSTISLYSWMKKGEQEEKIISTTERYNSIAPQWNKYVYFMIKNETLNEESILNFIYWEINWCLLLVRNKLKYKLYSYNG